MGNSPVILDPYLGNSFSISFSNQDTLYNLSQHFSGFRRVGPLAIVSDIRFESGGEKMSGVNSSKWRVSSRFFKS